MQKGETTRQRIIEQAAPIFNQRGYAGCSMHDVMQATGLEKGGLYRHFSNKEELAAEAFRYSIDKSMKVRTDHLDRSHGAVQLLRSFIERFVETTSMVRGGCPLLNTAVDADDGNPVLREMAREAFRDWRERLAKIVREGIRSGEVCESASPRQIANTIIATLEGALMMSRLDGNKTALKDAQAALDTVLGCLMAGELRVQTIAQGLKPQHQSGRHLRHD
jgi:AcrR family transcriptional regulator